MKIVFKNQMTFTGAQSGKPYCVSPWEPIEIDAAEIRHLAADDFVEATEWDAKDTTFWSMKTRIQSATAEEEVEELRQTIMGQEASGKVTDAQSRTLYKLAELRAHELDGRESRARVARSGKR